MKFTPRIPTTTPTPSKLSLDSTEIGLNRQKGTQWLIQHRVLQVEHFLLPGELLSTVKYDGPAVNNPYIRVEFTDKPGIAFIDKTVWAEARLRMRMAQPTKHYTR